MPLYASISDLTIDLAWVRSFKSVLITMLGAATSGRLPNWRWRDAKLETTGVPVEDKAAFIKPMLLLQTERLPEGSKWAYELKLDGYRAIAVKAAGRVRLWSRNEKDFGRRYPATAAALDKLPEPSLGIRSCYGRHFPWLQHLDRAWAQDTVPRIFPADEEHAPYRRAAWDTYLLFLSRIRRRVASA